MARSSVQTNFVKWYHRHVADLVKQVRRQIRRAITSPGLAWGFHRFNRAIKRRDWRVAHGLLEGLAKGAERVGDTRLLAEMGFSAERLGEHEWSTRWAAANARLSGKVSPTDWKGEDLSDATLLVRFMESEKQGLAIGLNMAGYVAKAAKRARHCTLIVERRLVPIFARTLPDVRVLPFPSEAAAGQGTRLVTANALTLRTVLGAASDEIEKSFFPLKADQAESSKLRETYRAGRKMPLIGISWWSSHFGKDLPSLEDWAELVRSVNGIFVNIQYGDIAADLEVLKRAAPDRFIVDDSVDQMKDMDRFAAQLGALDAVVTISNTGAHLAGGMGVPTFLIRDDWFRRQWPVLSDRTPWYPHARVYGKEGRPWNELLERVKGEMSKLPSRD